MKSKLFSFNVIFEPQATQRDVFEFSGIKKLIAMAIKGFNTTCFCYGQTGSGKTHTLTGPPGMVRENKSKSIYTEIKYLLVIHFGIKVKIYFYTGKELRSERND